ncbi:MAG: hypothetical protein FJZ05_00170 [Candidatus Nealsonbacteria bacterium]|nr:hypothetical protein [Candidatus Nealsonbacteria bacterium]
MNKSSLVSSLPLSLPLIRFKVGLKFVWFFLLTVIVSLLISSIYLLNVYTSEVYAASQYEKKVNQLSEENKLLEINMTRAGSLDKVDNYVQNFERAGRIEYIRVLESTALAK